MKSPDLIDYRDISKMLGVSLQHTRNRLCKRPDFPAPAINVSQKIRRWRKADVEKWASVK